MQTCYFEAAAMVYSLAAFGYDILMYPPSEPYQTGYLSVGDGHELYYEQCGNAQGIPAVFLHGGPGAGFVPDARRLFNPEKYRLILFDQRGAGQSRYEDYLRNNTIKALTEDVERLRNHLGIEKWLVFGASWGTARAMFYAMENPRQIQALVLAGMFTATREELDWQSEAHGAAAMMMPDAYETMAALFAGRPAGQTVWEALEQIFEREDEQRQMEAALAYMVWNRMISRHDPPLDLIEAIERERDIHFRCIRIVSHFYKNFYKEENRRKILEGAAGLGGIPCYIIHGRYDLICSVNTACKLHKAFPGSDLRIVQNGGHSGLDPAVAQALIEVLDET